MLNNILLSGFNTAYLSICPLKSIFAAFNFELCSNYEEGYYNYMCTDFFEVQFATIW